MVHVLLSFPFTSSLFLHICLYHFLTPLLSPFLGYTHLQKYMTHARQLHTHFSRFVYFAFFHLLKPPLHHLSTSTYISYLKGTPSSLLFTSLCSPHIFSLLSARPSNHRIFSLQDTLIVWSENDTTELALSFQERAGCDEVWYKICQV